MVRVAGLEPAYPCSQGKWDSRFPTPGKSKSLDSLLETEAGRLVMQSGSGIHDARSPIGLRLRTFWCPEMDCLYH